MLKTSATLVERKCSYWYSRVNWMPSLSTSPSAATELCSFQEVLCSCVRDSYFSVPFGGSLCELLTSLHSPAMGMDLCRSLNFKFRITPLPAKYGHVGFMVAANCRLLGQNDWFYEWRRISLLCCVCWIIKESPISWGIYMGNFHCAIEGRKPFQGIRRSSLQIKF